MARYNICTNFYSNYLYKGLAQYHSLEKTSNDFCLWILCMDKETYIILSKLKLKNARLIKLSDVESQELLSVKKSRNKAEYCWTLKSSFISYLFKKYRNISSLFYFDGDIFFFNDIKLAYREIGNNSVAMAPHRFPEDVKSMVNKTGVFNAGAVYFKKDSTGLKALERWRKQCIEWCYWRLEGGKMTDQMYLNEWPRLYKNLHQFKHLGMNLAPWNISQYRISQKGGKVYVNKYPLVFYHFHQFKIYSDLTFNPSYGYNMSSESINLICRPYEDSVLMAIKEIDKVKPSLRRTLEHKDRIQDTLQGVRRLVFPIYWKIKASLHF
jgi:hypothetical protein